MKIMLDTNFYRDPALFLLCEDHGQAAGFRYLVICCLLRDHRGAMSIINRGTLGVIGSAIGMTSTEAKQFIDILCSDDYTLLKTDGERFWSERLLRDINAYQEKCDKARAAANIRHMAKLSPAPIEAAPEVPPAQISNGETIAQFLANMMKHDKIRQADFFEAASTLGISAKERNTLWNLSKTYSKAAISHYAQLCSAQLKSRAEVRADFCAYLESWMLRDKAESKGFFKSGQVQQPASALPSRKLIKHDTGALDSVQDILKAKAS